MPTTAAPTRATTVLATTLASPAPPPSPADHSAASAPVAPCTDLTTTHTHATAQPAGERLPAVRLPCLAADSDADSAIDRGALGGHPTVANLWASWCPHCRAEMPLPQHGHTEYGAAVQFLGVNSKDRPDFATTVLADLGVTYPPGGRPGRPAARRIGHPRRAGHRHPRYRRAITDTHIGPRDGDLDALLTPLPTPPPGN